MEMFAFDPKKDQDYNVAQYIEYLREIDPELSELLSKHISSIEKFPLMNPTQKNGFRVILTKDVLSVVEKAAKK